MTDKPRRPSTEPYDPLDAAVLLAEENRILRAERDRLEAALRDADELLDWAVGGYMAEGYPELVTRFRAWKDAARAALGEQGSG